MIAISPENWTEEDILERELINRNYISRKEIEKILENSLKDKEIYNENSCNEINKLFLVIHKKLKSLK